MAAEASTLFEITNTDLKRYYIEMNIKEIVDCMKNVSCFCGAFGTGYPFYVTDEEHNFSLPVITEQLRYNDELLQHAMKSIFFEWSCDRCLSINGSKMPDLKCFCKSCDRIEDQLKPRKVINRLPDLDIWMICQDDQFDNAKSALEKNLYKKNMKTSDNDVLGTVRDVASISLSLANGVFPDKWLPLDIHILKESEFFDVLSKVSSEIFNSINEGTKPYVAIWPDSLRKTWQKDDTPYNFIFDFLFSLTPLDMDSSIRNKIDQVRNSIALMLKKFNSDENVASNLLFAISSDATKRRFENSQLQKVYEGRLKKWGK